MKLIRLTYEAANWKLLDLELGDVNLIVGQNATGKSRTLLTIDFLYKMITQKTGIDWGVKWDITFKNTSDDLINFKFNSKYLNGGAIGEEITINNETILKRSSNEGFLKNLITGQFDEVNPPDNKMVIHSNRDVKKYPYLEEIARWAENSYGFKFGNISPLAVGDILRRKKQEYDIFNSVSDINQLYRELNKKTTERILNDIQSVGYGKISEISSDDSSFDDDIIIREKDIEMDIPYNKLSQGMFRTLSVLIFIEYLISIKQPATVIIDDLCEGLDYERATKLGKLIFEKCHNNNIQLIATSNDMFLMDVVDIKNWNVLRRDGKEVKAINRSNSPDLFKDFKYTGLSNFDFFSSDYINKKSS